MIDINEADSGLEVDPDSSYGVGLTGGMSYAAARRAALGPSGANSNLSKTVPETQVPGLNFNPVPVAPQPQQAPAQARVPLYNSFGTYTVMKPATTVGGNTRSASARAQDRFYERERKLKLQARKPPVPRAPAQSVQPVARTYRVEQQTPRQRFKPLGRLGYKPDKLPAYHPSVKRASPYDD